MSEKILLTKFSHGAGCGCKIAPNILEKILHSHNSLASRHPNILVGYNTKDDAAVYDMGNGRAIISTTDFFMPIVDSPYDFGRIAAANAISDVYAMGGKPLLALAILGWPVEKIPVEAAQQVLDGARAICTEAGIALAGGHSIDSPEPIFGLVVTGEAALENIKKNSTAADGCSLFLTKPLGVGMLATAHKRGLANETDFNEAVQTMTTLNSAGEDFGKLNCVKAMTDVTGFGLLGHLLEMCEGSNLSAEISYSKIPKLKNISHYLEKMIYPDFTFKNWSSFEKKISLQIASEIHGSAILLLCDPQTSGGLLVAVEKGNEENFIAFSKEKGLMIESFGKMYSSVENERIIVNP